MTDKPTRVRPGWYVIQVTTGTEDKMCHTITRMCQVRDAAAAESSRPKIGLKECFSPRFVSRKKRMGEWYDVERAMLPGYVIAEVKNPAELVQGLGRLHDFARIITNGETYSPLDDDERNWLEAQFGEGSRTVPISFGYREGDTVVVTSGPLKGHEAIITKIDRKNCLANVEFHAGTMTFKTTVGLVLLPADKRES